MNQLITIAESRAPSKYSKVEEREDFHKDRNCGWSLLLHCHCESSFVIEISFIHNQIFEFLRYEYHFECFALIRLD